MHLLINGKQYPCGVPSISELEVEYRGVMNLKPPVEGKVALRTDDGFVLREDDTADWKRVECAAGMLLLSNIELQEPGGGQAPGAGGGPLVELRALMDGHALELVNAQLALAEQYERAEAMEAELTHIQLALAEIYEHMMGG